MSGHDKQMAEPNTRTDPAQHADHLAGKHHCYDPDCDDCRRKAEEDYRKKLESGELNNIEFKD